MTILCDWLKRKGGDSNNCDVLKVPENKIRDHNHFFLCYVEIYYTCYLHGKDIILTYGTLSIRELGSLSEEIVLFPERKKTAVHKTTLRLRPFHGGHIHFQFILTFETPKYFVNFQVISHFVAMLGIESHAQEEMHEITHRSVEDKEIILHLISENIENYWKAFLKHKSQSLEEQIINYSRLITHKKEKLTSGHTYIPLDGGAMDDGTDGGMGMGAHGRFLIGEFAKSVTFWFTRFSIDDQPERNPCVLNILKIQLIGRINTHQKRSVVIFLQRKSPHHRCIGNRRSVTLADALASADGKFLAIGLSLLNFHLKTFVFE
uniref:Uncharacterized protein n=1 Tax=Romanomermis culicivorax TaxID=13658 RepID=A0A915J745_ROMCU